MCYSWEDVPGYFDFQRVYDAAVATAPPGAVLVEVGALYGRSALYMAQRIRESGKQLHFFVVDTWKPHPDFDSKGMRADQIAKHGSMFGAFVHYIENSGGLQDYINVLRIDSHLAAAAFGGWLGPLHFVFLDAGHDYDEVEADLNAWHAEDPAIIGGHDWSSDWPGVERAAREYAQKYRKALVQIPPRSWLACDDALVLQSIYEHTRQTP